MDEDHLVTLEIDYDGCGRLQFELPPDTTDEEIKYIKTLVARADMGSIDLIDPDTLEVVFSLRLVTLH